MKGPHIKALSLTVIALIALSAVPLGRTQEQTPSYKGSFLLQNEPDGDKTYELNITISEALYQYYTIKNHALYSPSDIAQFVTPYSLKPIADSLWQIYNNTEDFTNGVLMLVHQMNYQEIVPGRYPIEVLVNGYGDCDLFAFIASSILEAGGIKTVLLYYKDKLHMEIGVDLGSPPSKARVEVFSINYQNVSYYIGECTGGKWRTGWRIGETPTEYQNITVQVITLENIEQNSPEQVSANLKELDASTVMLQVSPSLIIDNGKVTIRGQVLPQTANENVTLRAKINNGGWTTIGTVQTESDGQFNYNWTTTLQGSIMFQASWVGNRQFNGATSVQASLIILPLFIIIEIIACTAATVIVTLIFMKAKSRKPKAIALQQTTSPNQTQPQNPEQPAQTQQTP